MGNIIDYSYNIFMFLYDKPNTPSLQDFFVTLDMYQDNVFTKISIFYCYKHSQKVLAISVGNPQKKSKFCVLHPDKTKLQPMNTYSWDLNMLALLVVSKIFNDFLRKTIEKMLS